MGFVPDSTFFCLDEDRDTMVGAVNIRHYLNEYLLKYGGHIGDGIRPSERRKGYATKMISLALEKCKKLGMDKVLLVCDKDNIGSVKSIINNDGVLENEVLEGEGNTISYDVWLTARANLVSNFTYHHKNQKHFNQFTMSLLFCVILFYRCWGQKPCYSTLKILHKSFNFPRCGILYISIKGGGSVWHSEQIRINNYLFCIPRTLQDQIHP